MQLKDITTDIKKIERRIKKVFTYGERADKLALSRMMNLQMETYKWEIIEAKKEAIDNQLEKLESHRKGLKYEREKLEKDSNPFDFSIGKLPLNNEVQPSPTLNGNHTVTVGGSVRKGHSRAKKVLDRAEVMKKIGEGMITNKVLAPFFDMAVATFRDKTKELRIPTSGKLSSQVYITDEQDGFKSYKELENAPTVEVTKKESRKELSMLEAGKLLVKEQTEEGEDMGRTFEDLFDT